MNELKGIIPPMLTIFEEDGSIDDDETRKFVDFLIKSGVNGLFPASTLGEFTSLKINERKKLIRIVTQETDGRVPVFAGTGSSSLKVVEDLSKYAKNIGVDGVIVVTPYYLTPNQEGIQEYFEKIANSISIPLLIYNIPSFTGVDIQPETISRLDRNNENIIGIKDSSGDFEKILEINKQTKDGFKIFQGLDNLLLPSLFSGCSGGIVGSANIAPKFALSLYDEYNKGKIKVARSIQRNKIDPLVEACMKHGVFPSGFKEALKMIGFGSGMVRTPITSPTEEEKQKIMKELSDLNII